MKQEEVWNDFYSRNRTAWRGNTVIPVVDTGRALDLGCGNGKTVSTLIDEGFEVTGIDFSSVAVEQCRKNFPDSRFEVASACNLPFEDDSFDYITAVHVLEHLNDEELSKAVDEIYRVLKKGGHVFIRSFTENDMRSKDRKDSDIFYRFYDIDTVVDAFACFDVVSAEVKEDRTRFGTIRSRVEVLLASNKA